MGEKLRKIKDLNGHILPLSNIQSIVYSLTIIGGSYPKFSDN